MKEEFIANRREQEKKVVGEMISLYCRKNHHPDGDFCDSCRELRNYAWQRVDHCPFMENKTFCSNCRVHCYKPEMREKIREVMRFSGPRMLLYHPLLAIFHLVLTLKEKRKLEKDEG